MPRDIAAYLQDIMDAAYAIADVMRGVSLEDYRATRSIRSSVEREFIIIGAALRRISALDEELFASISNSRAIVDFRNLLAHDYGAIDDDSVFGVVYSTNTTMHLTRHRSFTAPSGCLFLWLSAGR
ncbi:MAG: DUF86 domain-containing protein [Synechococcaceae bacterium WB6_3B_236]|nr:DUF86 domain-containing protein [Synechococcaceae bacterium WB6_3B_236]